MIEKAMTTPEEEERTTQLKFISPIPQSNLFPMRSNNSITNKLQET